MFGVLQQRGIGKQVAEQPLSVLERHFEEPLALGIDDVEHDVLQGSFVALAVLQ